MREWIDAEIQAEVELLANRSGQVEQTIVRACNLYDVSLDDVIRGSRRPRAIMARQAAAWLLRRHGLSYPKIGKALACDHTTALYACRKIDASPATRALLIGLEVVA
jgi:chromosomal replication initiation ATPase DnaA